MDMRDNINLQCVYTYLNDCQLLSGLFDAHFNSFNSCMPSICLFPKLTITVNVERFTGLNIHGFNPIKFFVGTLLQCLGQQCLLFNYS